MARDLARVEVTGEDELKHRWRPPDDSREVAEEDSEVDRLVDQLVRVRLTSRIGARIDADELDTPASCSTVIDSSVEQHDGGDSHEGIAVDALRERVAAVCEVVVTEHHVTAAEAREEPLELSHSGTSRD